LVVVGPRRHTDAEIREFTGIRLVARIPSDSTAASVASGDRRGRRRLSCSRMVASAACLASDLADPPSVAISRSEPATSNHDQLPPMSDSVR
jgi:hypothetical protein